MRTIKLKLRKMRLSNLIMPVAFLAFLGLHTVLVKVVASSRLDAEGAGSPCYQEGEIAGKEDLNKAQASCFSFF